jgi:nucleotide-binding universal stress UspA family protein
MKILIAVDGSECSDAAANEAVKRPWPPGSEVRIISVAEALPANKEALELPGHYFEDLERAERNRAASIAERAAGQFVETSGRSLPVTTTVVMDSPKDAILDESERWGADLIVVGSHGYRGYKRALLGSVSQAVAAQAKCSVEIVRSCRRE